MSGQDEFLYGLALVLVAIMLAPGQPRLESIPLDEEPDTPEQE